MNISLRARIRSDMEENKHFRDQPKWKPFVALEKVVEYHKPYINYLGQECFCEACGEEISYPCPTIKVIAEVLNG